MVAGQDRWTIGRLTIVVTGAAREIEKEKKREGERTIGRLTIDGSGSGAADKNRHLEGFGAGM